MHTLVAASRGLVFSESRRWHKGKRLQWPHALTGEQYGEAYGEEHLGLYNQRGKPVRDLVAQGQLQQALRHRYVVPT